MATIHEAIKSYSFHKLTRLRTELTVFNTRPLNYGIPYLMKLKLQKMSMNSQEKIYHKNWKPRCSCGGCILCKLHLVQFLYLQMVMLIVTLLHPYHIILLFTCTFSSFAIICRLIVLLVFFVCKGATLNKIYCIVLFSCS